MVSVTREMSCQPQDVLEVLADGWSYAIWVVGTSRIRAVDPGWPAEGSRIAHSVGLWPLLIDDVTSCLSWDQERGIELQARGWPVGEARVQIEVRGRPGGCVVRITEDAVRGPGTLIPKPLRSAGLVPRNTETLHRLALLAEGRGTRGAGSQG